MSYRIGIVVALALFVTLEVSLWNIATAAPGDTPPFLKVGEKYTIGAGTLTAPNAEVLEIRSDGWVKIKTHRRDVWWINVNQVWGIMEKE